MSRKIPDSASAAVDVSMLLNEVFTFIERDTGVYTIHKLTLHFVSEVLMKRLRNWSKVGLAAGTLFACVALAPVFATEVSTDFESEKGESPWGFSTANAKLFVITTQDSINPTKKMMFSMSDQKGGRFATKTFTPAITGSVIHFNVDWYPGQINDKGGNKDENGGMISLIDSNQKTLFNVSYIRNERLRWTVGNITTDTSFTEALTWYSLDLAFDIKAGTLSGTITDKTTGTSEQVAASLANVDFSGVLSQMEVTGIRTAGNNITWTTYIDNIKFDYEPISSKTITTVEAVPYKRVYVNEAKDAAALNLPKSVLVKLADGTSTKVNVSEWTAVESPATSSTIVAKGTYNPATAGVYTFRGTLAPSGGVENTLGRVAYQYVYNRLPTPESKRQTEWFDRGVVAVKADKGIFVSWRLLADEYTKDITFNVYRDGKKQTKKPISMTNFVDKKGKAGATYRVETLIDGKALPQAKGDEAVAEKNEYLALKMQKPAAAATLDGTKVEYALNDATTGDLDGDGALEIIVKWYPKNAIDSSFSELTSPTLFDAYKLDGTPLWRINLGLSMTSGAHYNQIVVADFDGDGKSEVFLKTGEGTRVYGVKNGAFDESTPIAVVGDLANEGKGIITADQGGKGHISNGTPEYVTFFRGDTGAIIDTTDYAFPVQPVESWGDNFYNRSDRWNACMAYLDGVRPSAVLGRGYYARTAYAAYNLVDGKIQLVWTFDTNTYNGYGAGLGNHNLVVADVDNDGCDEIIAGSLAINNDGTILYAMDGAMNRQEGSHGDALHIAPFNPDVEGFYVWDPHEVDKVASLELHDAATGETQMAFYAYKDAGRAVAANITKRPGYEMWGTGGNKIEDGGAVYNIKDGFANPVSDNNKGLAVNFKIYWDGDLLHELMDAKDGAPCEISKYNESSKSSNLLKIFEGTHSCNGTKGTPTLQADILGDWREEVVMASSDDKELRIYTTTMPTDYRIYTLLHDPVYRASVAWQNNGYNQPTCMGIYLGEDIAKTVKDGKLPVPTMNYTKK